MKENYGGIFERDTTPTRIIFLDIDGVMVTDFSAENREKENGHDHLFNTISVNLLNAIVDQCDCDIVISSSWRKRDLEWMRNIFSTRGFKYPERIIGETMRGYHFVEKGAHLPIPRGVEIKAWIDKFVRHIPGQGFVNNTFQYAILDDDSDMLLEQKDNFVKTDTLTGLTHKEAQKLIHIFNN